MGMAAILVMWSRPREQIFVPQSHWGTIRNLALIGQVVLEKIFENGGWRMDNDGWTMDHGYTISSPMSLKAQVSLKCSSKRPSPVFEHKNVPFSDDFLRIQCLS